MKYPQKIHVWDLPLDKVYIRFRQEFSNEFFGLAHKKFGSYRKIGEFLNIKRADTTIPCNWMRGITCYPLCLIVALLNKLDVPLSGVEDNIIKIRYKSHINKRGGNSGKPIINPILPVVINEDFAEILGHLCGDGTISMSSPHKGICFGYINSEPSLIEHFKKLVNRIFGEIEPNILVREGGNYTRPNYYLQYPSILSAFILSVFKFQPGDKKDIPEVIFDSSDLAKARFLRAMFDDEGYVSLSNKRIEIGLKPFRQIQKIKVLLKDLRIESSKIYKYKPEFYRIFLANQNSILQFQKIIGFKHTAKDQKIQIIINKGWKFKRYKDGEAKLKIIEMLSEKEGVETAQISWSLGRTKMNVRKHLKNLLSENKIQKKKIKRKQDGVIRYFDSWYIKR
jgi:hypothetical protein